ncbi:MAG TPA: hypothetical protein PLF21_03920 [Exilispira sp.]|nr:hypothetical protein [Exilispira sp.]
MISYYDDINISELICYEGKLAIVSEKSPFGISNSKQVSDIGLIDQFFIIDVKKSFSSFIHITSIDYEVFKKRFEIEKINYLLNNPIKTAILNITKESRDKKIQLIDFIKEKMPCEIINYYVSRFGLLLVFSRFDFDNNLFSKKIIEKSRNNQKENLVPFSIKTKYEISGKTFIWIYYPEDLFLIHNKYLFENYLKLYSVEELFKPIFDFKFRISTFSFEIFNNLKPEFYPSVYLFMDKEQHYINHFTEKKVEIVKTSNFEKIYKEYIKIVNQIK